MLMYQNTRGTTGLPKRREAMICTNQRPLNISAPAQPISFQGLAWMPVQASHGSGLSITPAAITARRSRKLLRRGDLAAADQPGDAAQVGDSDQGAIEVVVLGHAGRARAVVDRDADRLPAGALHQRRQVAVHVVEPRQVEEGLAL